jgi:hypothetical protein
MDGKARKLQVRSSSRDRGLRPMIARRNWSRNMLPVCVCVRACVCACLYAQLSLCARVDYRDKKMRQYNVRACVRVNTVVMPVLHWSRCGLQTATCSALLDLPRPPRLLRRTARGVARGDDSLPPPRGRAGPAAISTGRDATKRQHTHATIAAHVWLFGAPSRWPLSVLTMRCMLLSLASFVLTLQQKRV